jgi:hypothetical protein
MYVHFPSLSSLLRTCSEPVSDIIPQCGLRRDHAAEPIPGPRRYDAAQQRTVQMYPFKCACAASEMWKSNLQEPNKVRSATCEGALGCDSPSRAIIIPCPSGSIKCTTSSRQPQSAFSIRYCVPRPNGAAISPRVPIPTSECLPYRRTPRRQSRQTLTAARKHEKG